jgi:hypothetical protein
MMAWFKKALDLRTPEERSDDEIGDCLLQLRALIDEAEYNGWQFRPHAVLARRALKAINWLR